MDTRKLERSKKVLIKSQDELDDLMDDLSVLEDERSAAEGPFTIEYILTMMADKSKRIKFNHKEYDFKMKETLKMIDSCVGVIDPLVKLVNHQTGRITIKDRYYSCLDDIERRGLANPYILKLIMSESYPNLKNYFVNKVIDDSVTV